MNQHFRSIQLPVPKFEGNNKKTREIRIKPLMLKSSSLTLQEIVGRIVGRKGEKGTIKLLTNEERTEIDIWQNH